MKWVKEHLIYLTIHGSRSYGMNTDLSDLDIKGICVPPPDVEYNLFHRFEQSENNLEINSLVDHLKNPLNPKIEGTVYSLRKFFLLAAEVNPNIIELLWTDPEHHIILTPFAKKLIQNRNLFLSNKARWTWSGYACAQVKKIERHRKWIIMGNLQPPKREDFGLLPTVPRGIDNVIGYIKSKVEQWNLNQFPIDEMLRAQLKENIWELIYEVSNKQVSWDNWPDAYASAVMIKMKDGFNLNDDVVRLINAERAYAKAKSLYESWLHWKQERNPARKVLEEKAGYDTKHASMLVRLLRMGYEIITQGKVIVNRRGLDADELLAIKNGSWSYEKVMEFKDEMESKLNVEYARQKQLIAEGKSVPIPREVNKEKLNQLYHDLYNHYWDDERMVNELFVDNKDHIEEPTEAIEFMRIINQNKI